MFNFLKKNKASLPQFWNDYALKFKEKPTEKLVDTVYTVLDTETTGFDYSNDRILCIGAVKLVQQQIAIRDGFEVFVTQQVYGKDAAPIHGILKNSTVPRVTELEALEQFITYVGNSVIIAHHAIFDLNMINNALLRNGLPELKNTYLDTSHLYKKTIIRSNLITRKENYTLDELADKFSISKKDRHTAMGDAYITAILFLKIISKLKESKKEVTLSFLRD
ncbi:Exonuclease RNase T and DNA polymerase III [Cellulophaga algicola DSM 14237]|uniref:Exonuclease RNase T and DNA polymerase III n=1 Tax=Cellulophaga algicola (strain DSM 14237 / IC166 / ACAM 630) TaxID=688270 RepID=E6X5F9_CELAD|nr:3'-5' exonuclease [Cellulophaga algicola]ADV50514.1 Exonuclease RNase T and DNA polymerase III [Cellulophaga algicola DSM 14237]